jgi:hypothetical protein
VSRQPEQQPFRTFKELEVYQAAKEFRKATDGFARKLSGFEKFGLSQVAQDEADAIPGGDPVHDSMIQQFNACTT